MKMMTASTKKASTAKVVISKGQNLCRALFSDAKRCSTQQCCLIFPRLEQHRLEPGTSQAQSVTSVCVPYWLVMTPSNQIT